MDCFYEGDNMLVIHPDECIDCGVCEPECPVMPSSPTPSPGSSAGSRSTGNIRETWPNITTKKPAPPMPTPLCPSPTNSTKYFSTEPGEATRVLQSVSVNLTGQNVACCSAKRTLLRRGMASGFTKIVLLCMSKWRGLSAQLGSQERRPYLGALFFRLGGGGAIRPLIDGSSCVYCPRRSDGRQEPHLARRWASQVTGRGAAQNTLESEMRVCLKKEATAKTRLSYQRVYRLSGPRRRPDRQSSKSRRSPAPSSSCSSSTSRRTR